MNHSGRLPFDDPVYIYVPLLDRPQLMHACHADASRYLDVILTIKMLQRFYMRIAMEAYTKW